MRIATLQFSPTLGKVQQNISRANTLLSSLTPHEIDLLVLPELAFSGYNHGSLPAILPFLEPTQRGPSTQWAATTAARLHCIVAVGYPEIATAASSSLSSSSLSSESGGRDNPPVCYNALVAVAPDGAVVAHYRKTHLYVADESWATESPDGWMTARLPLAPPLLVGAGAGQMKDEGGAPTTTTLAAFGICMDLNPHRFTAPWSRYEFASAARTAGASLLVLSMAWLTAPPSSSSSTSSSSSPSPPSPATTEPDWATLSYWIARLEPMVWDAEREVVVVVANRSGEEPGAKYAGTSWVGKVRGGEVGVWGWMGRGEEGVLKVDTGGEVKWVLGLERGGGDGEGG